MPEWLTATITWLNVWARLSACEKQRREQSGAIAELQAEVRSLESQLQSVRHFGAIGSITVDASGCILQANAAFSDLSGYSADELRKMRIAELIPYRYRARHDANFGAVMAPGGRATRDSPLVVELRRKDGEEVQVFIMLTEFVSGSGKTVRADVKLR